MRPLDILSPSDIYIAVDAKSKKRVLEIISEHFAKNINVKKYEDIFNALLAREKLGSTALTNGVAVPHARVADISQPFSSLILLKEPIDFAATDRKKIDILFSLIVPEEAHEEHLNLLAMVAEIFNNKELLKLIRKATNSDRIYQLISEYGSG